ncbi:MAG: zinc ribbon domain-containing protein [Candidatus Bipolaricaulota bacterium]|nr:zinc ribbon domain-containing protein [Candidatus Bipolaricaulota bacterium]
MRRALSIVLLILGTLGFAQQIPVVIERLAISLWPEYDDPRLLVIYRGELAEDPTSSLVFTLPRTAQIHAVAHVGPAGTLLTDAWQILPEDNEQLVLFTPGSRRFQVEYYDDVLGTAPERAFVFQFRSDRYDIKNLEIEVQQPLRATGFQASPALEPQGVDTRGFHYFGRRVGAVPPGTLIEQRVSYRKTDTLPSLRPAALSSLVWAGAGLIVAALGVISLLWLRQRRRTARATAPQRPARFCVRCGYRFRADEHFCPQCGQRRSA